MTSKAEKILHGPSKQHDQQSTEGPSKQHDQLWRDHTTRCARCWRWYHNVPCRSPHSRSVLILGRQLHKLTSISQQ